MSAALRRLGRIEFTSLLALSMALAALGIDLMLPAFPQLRRDLGLPADSNAVAGMVTAYFLGMAVGQVLYGPLADRFGRRPILWLGFGIYGAGALVTAVAPTLELVLAARVLWGLGAAGPRVITLAVVRDSFHGEQMSRAMSFIMAVFILVPVLAPSIGAVALTVTTWRWLFGLCALVAAAVLVWSVRLPETLRPEHRLPLGFRRLRAAAHFVVSNRLTVGYTLAMTALWAVFASYLASSQIIFSQTFGQPDRYPVIFGGIAGVMGLAMLLNARIVGPVGTRRLAHVVLLAYVVVATCLAGVALVTGGRPALWLFLVLLAALVTCQALLIPNFNTIAMAPMAAVAGTASSLIGGVQIAVGSSLGALLDRAYDGTVVPLTLGFLAAGLAAVAVVLVAERGRLFRPLEAPPLTPEERAATAVTAEA